MKKDEELFDLLRWGDKRAFDALFLRYYGTLRDYAARLVCFHDAEELAQELMVGIWVNRETIELDSSVRAYLFRAMRNKCLNHIEWLRVREEAHALIAERCKEAEDPDCYVEQELAEQIELALERLPATYRESFVMQRIEGRSYVEIARTLSVSPKTVDYRIQQALKGLRAELRDFLLDS